MFKQLLLGGGKPSTLIQSAFEDVGSMLHQAAKMYDHALPALFGDKPLEVDLRALDDVIDDGERMVRRTVLEHLTVNPRQELVASLLLVSIVQDAERIGDHARGLGEVTRLYGGPLEGQAADELRQIAERVRPEFEVCERAFREDDLEGARQVVEAHAELKPAFAAFYSRLAQSDLTADRVIAHAIAARLLRRTSAHLRNIATTVTQPFDRIRYGDEDI
jgi:Na+/phosphate symporter